MNPINSIYRQTSKPVPPPTFINTNMADNRNCLAFFLTLKTSYDSYTKRNLKILDEKLFPLIRSLKINNNNFLLYF